jgi:hypothetical protein
MVRTEVDAARATTGFFTNPVSSAAALFSFPLIFVPFVSANMSEAAVLLVPLPSVFFRKRKGPPTDPYIFSGPGSTTFSTNSASQGM